MCVSTLSAFHLLSAPLSLAIILFDAYWAFSFLVSKLRSHSYLFEWKRPRSPLPKCESPHAFSQGVLVLEMWLSRLGVFS